MGIFKDDSQTESVLIEIRDEIKKLREDVQRAGVISGLLSRPGGMAMRDIIAAADKFAEEVKD